MKNCYGTQIDDMAVVNLTYQIDLSNASPSWRAHESKHNNLEINTVVLSGIVFK